MSFTGSQSYNAVFETDLNNTESTLLFQETASFGTPRGLGVWRKPQNGGIYKADGGQFVFLSGRPYRYNVSHLRSNVEFILGNFFHEIESDDPIWRSGSLEQNHPNPFPGSTSISFQLYRPSSVSIHIFDVLGRHIRILLSKQSFSEGRHERMWDGKDDKGNNVSSGVYFYKIDGSRFHDTRKMVLLR